MIASARSTIKNNRLLVNSIIILSIGFSSDCLLAGEPHAISLRGKTLVEAEAYSASSDESPYAEPNRKCSGEQNLGFYWKNTWFEQKVDVPKIGNYQVSFQASSPTGTQIVVNLMTFQEGEPKEVPLAKIDVPQTESWEDYVETKKVIVALPSGSHTLRFSNLEDGANVDYITFAAFEGDAVTTARPAKNSGPDINPLKGFKSGWWREEEHASVGFQYIEWGQFEPKDDAFDWEYVESVLDRPGSKDRHFILQFVVDWDWREPVDSNYLGPKWLLKKVGEKRGTSDPKNPGSRKMRVTNYNNPVFIQEATEAIETLSKRFENDPRKFVFQVGILGFWGEWHTFPREDWSPTEQTKKTILNAYLDNLGSNGLTQIRYPDESVAKPTTGMGYTNGSATLTDHGKRFNQLVAERKLWMNGPVSGEWPPNVEDNVWKRFFQTNEGNTYLEQAGYSTLLAPESKQIAEKLSGWKQDERFMKMHRKLGYNFQASEVRHLVSIGESVTQLEVDLYNSGIAPFYKDWNVELAIIEKKSKNVVDRIMLKGDLRELAPKKTMTLVGSSSQKLDPMMDYQVALRICQPGADEPKEAPWRLNARNVYVVLANDLEIIEGLWDESNALKGGWNVLDDLERRKPRRSKPGIGNALPLGSKFRHGLK